MERERKDSNLFDNKTESEMNACSACSTHAAVLRLSAVVSDCTCSMYVCMYVCARVCVYVCMYVYVCVCLCVYAPRSALQIFTVPT